MSDSNEIMLQAISNIGMARSLKRTSKIGSLLELKKSVTLMNKAIKMDPENLENRKIRVRHLIGITMKSPRSFHKEIKEDLSFLKNLFPELNSEDQSYYLSALGEYEVFCGEKEKGIKTLKDCIEQYPNSSMTEYTRIILESLN